MDKDTFQRGEERLRYQWPIWFGEDVTQAGFFGLMVDLSSGGLAFTCTCDKPCFREGQQLTVRFEMPRFGRPYNPDDAVGVIRTGRVRYVTSSGTGTCRLGLQFDTPLSLKPAEEAKLTTACRNARR